MAYLVLFVFALGICSNLHDDFFLMAASLKPSDAACPVSCTRDDNSTELWQQPKTKPARDCLMCLQPCFTNSQSCFADQARSIQSATAPACQTTFGCLKECISQPSKRTQPGCYKDCCGKTASQCSKTCDIRSQLQTQVDKMCRKNVQECINSCVLSETCKPNGVPVIKA